jgi:hypothetical protein
VLGAITYRQVVPKGEEGEAVWVIEVATTASGIHSEVIPSEFIHATDLNYLEDEITEAVERLSAQIDWSPLIDDNRNPYVDSVLPSDYEVPLETSVEVVIKDPLPSAGIDISSITMTVDGFDVTSELDISGDPYEYKVKWSPFLRVTDEY